MSGLKLNNIYLGNSSVILRTLPKESVNCVVTSPPYWSLRNYLLEPIIWDSDNGCEHDWGILLDNLKKENRENFDKSTLSSKSNATNETLPKDSGQFCNKCGAWKGCVDKETEILTKEGWKKHYEIDKDDIIATFNKKKEIIEYQPIEKKYVYNHNGKMIHIKNFYLDCLLTLEHRVLCKSDKHSGKRCWTTDWYFQFANKLKLHQGLKIPVSSPFKDGSYSIGENLAELIGWILTDGTIYKGRGNRIVIYQSKSKGIARILFLLNELGIKYNIHKRKEKTNYCNNPLKRYYIRFSGEWGKRIKEIIPNKKPTKLLLFLVPKELKKLFDGIYGGDGSSQAIYGKDKSFRDWVQLLCFHLGYRTTHNDKKQSVNFSNNQTVTIYRERKDRNIPSQINETIYNGLVWCVKTKNQTFVARKNRKIFITGNSLGLEPTIDLYIKHLCDIFDEVKRVLRKDGSCFVVIGDTYAGSGSYGNNSGLAKTKIDDSVNLVYSKIRKETVPAKSLCCIPDKFKIEMINRGWLCRNEIIWEKPNGMCQSATDRFTVNYEKVYFFVKNQRYFFEQQFEPYIRPLDRRGGNTIKEDYFSKTEQFAIQDRAGRNLRPNELGRNKRCVWKDKKPYSIVEAPFRKDVIEYRDLPEHDKIREYLQKWRKKTKLTIDEVELYFENLAAHHWFEKDGSYPSIDNWLKLKNLFGFDSIYDVQMMTIHSKSGEKQSGSQGRNKRCIWKINTESFSAAHFACVDEKTEMLTIEGWKKYNELNHRQHKLVATYNLEKKIIEYQRLVYLKVYDFDDFLYKIGNRDLGILTTYNHRNIVKKRNGEEKIVLSENLAYSDKIRVCAKIKYPENNGIGKTFAELVGWIISEGYYKRCNFIRIYQNAGEKEKRIDWLLNKLEIPYSKKTRRRKYKDEYKLQVEWYLPKSPLPDWILKNVPNKELNRFLVSLPIIELKALFNGLIKGDGHVRKDDGRITFTQKSKNTKDWFQILALRLGYHSIKGDKIFLTKREYIGIRNTNGKGKAVKKIKYKGKIWCPTTPNGTWIARRNGRIFITGNTFPTALVAQCLAAGCPIEVCKKCGKPRKKVYEDTGNYIKQGGKGSKTADHIKVSPTSLTKQVRQKKFVGYSDCGCGEGFEPGIVLDPFVGSGTVVEVALRMKLNYVVIEANPEYVKITERRIEPLVRQGSML